MENNQRKRPRLGLTPNEMGWSQRQPNPAAARKADQDGAFDNTVQSDKVLYRDRTAARQAEAKAHEEKMSRTEPTAEEGRKIRIMRRERLDVERQIREGLDVRNNILRQEHRLGIDGALSYEELRRAERSSTLVGRRNPLKAKKSKFKGLGKTTRKRKNREKLLPSERRRRLSRTKIERNRKLYRDRIASKDLSITGPDGKKINIERLRKLRGISKNKPVTQRDVNSARRTMKAERVRNAGLQIRRRDQNTR